MELYTVYRNGGKGFIKEDRITGFYGDCIDGDCLDYGDGWKIWKGLGHSSQYGGGFIYHNSETLETGGFPDAMHEESGYYTLQPMQWVKEDECACGDDVADCNQQWAECADVLELDGWVILHKPLEDHEKGPKPVGQFN